MTDWSSNDAFLVGLDAPCGVDDDVCNNNNNSSVEDVDFREMLRIDRAVEE